MRAYANSWQKILLGSVRYEVPLYQRPYVWEKRDELESDRLGPFWADIKQTVDAYIEWRSLVADADGDESRVSAMTPHFFGAIVVDRPIKDGQVTTQEVIDGQQRLTTTLLFLAAATAVCERSGHASHASRLRKLWQHDADLGLTGAAAYKLTPTRKDLSVFVRVMEGSAVAEDATTTIGKAYRFFVDELDDWVANLPVDRAGEYFDALRETVYDHLLIVDIHLEDGDNAQGIFESLNAQGEKLLALDLVKNEVFRRARTARLDLDRLESELWAPEFNQDLWRKPVRQGRYHRPRAELFLMHWLIEQHSAEVSATGLYVEFQKLARARLAGGETAQGFIEGFVASAATYRQFEAYPPHSREAQFFARREVLDAGLPFPIALRLWRLEAIGVIPAGRRNVALAAVESWLVRRMLCGDTVKNYNNVTVQLLRAMDAAVASDLDPVSALIDYLRSADDRTNWWPDDDRVFKRLTEERLYGAMSEARVRFILETLEARLLTSKTETVDFPKKLTIEHVIPRSWEDEWPLPVAEQQLSEADQRDFIDKARQARNDRIHRLGNLSLLTESLNPALGNDPWISKRAELQKHSTLMLSNELVAGTDTDPASDGLHFDESRIDLRGARLARVLLDEWPGPMSPTWSQ